MKSASSQFQEYHKMLSVATVISGEVWILGVFRHHRGSLVGGAHRLGSRGIGHCNALDRDMDCSVVEMLVLNTCENIIES
jgi:hypothetical protein